MEEIRATDPKGAVELDPNTVANFTAVVAGFGKPAELYRQLQELVSDATEVEIFDGKASAGYLAKYLTKAADPAGGD